MGAGQQTILRKSKPLPLRVKPLPESGKPASFGGAVGTYRMKVELDRKEARVNDAVALRVAVEGEGSLQSVPPPALGISEISRSSIRGDVDGQDRIRPVDLEEEREWVVVPL